MLIRLTTLVLLGISAIHVYWAAGGRIGSDAAVPSRDGAHTFEPGPAATLAVATAALVVAGAAEMSRRGAGGGLPRLVALIAGLAFSGRSLGDFRLVGLTKRERGTTFARNDTWLYTPICMVLSAGCMVAARGHKKGAAA